MKHLHLFENHNTLDMPVNPSFLNYKKYEPYMHNPNIYDLMNQLNQLWYDMEQMDTDDDTMNQIGAELEELEQEIVQEIITSSAQEDLDELDEEQQEELEDVVERMTSILSQHSLSVKDSGYDEDKDEVWVEVDIEDEEVEFRIQNNYVTIEDFNQDIDMGYLYYDYERKGGGYDSHKDDFMNVLKDYLAATGDEYQEFIDNRN